LAAEGRAIVFSSHILEEVERLADNVLVIVSGRLAASGDFHRIRRLMTDRPHTFVIRSSDNRRLAAALIEVQSVKGVELIDGGLSVRASDFGAFALAVPPVARHRCDPLRVFRPTSRWKRLLLLSEPMNRRSSCFPATLLQEANIRVGRAGLPLLVALVFRAGTAARSGGPGPRRPLGGLS
jgi:hypothetical protein